MLDCNSGVFKGKMRSPSKRLVSQAMVQEFNQHYEGAKTHILLIGVGGYPYLKGGNSSLVQKAELARLGQLTSPVPSVVALYDKIISYDQQDVWSKKLGSIEILLSLPPGALPVLQGLDIENANLDNIRSSYFSWKTRCDQHEDNVAFFFFCGHGFQKGHHFLLADDFGRFPQNPWLGAFNFDDTRDAFYSCRAQTPIFLIDACRQVTIGMLEHGLTVAPIENPSLFNPEESKNHLTLKATASGGSAYGQKGKPTYFTQAVISGLEGLVAQQDPDDDWVVETSALGYNIHLLLDLINAKQSFKQRCQTAAGMSADIIKRKTAPNAWLEVSCSPHAAQSSAGLTCTEEAEDHPETFSRDPKADTWKLHIKAATYKIVASFSAGDGYSNATKRAALIPPFKKVKLLC